METCDTRLRTTLLKDFCEKAAWIDQQLITDYNFVGSRPWTVTNPEAIAWISDKAHELGIGPSGMQPVWYYSLLIARELLWMSPDGFSFELQKELRVDYWRAIFIARKVGGAEAWKQLHTWQTSGWQTAGELLNGRRQPSHQGDMAPTEDCRAVSPS